MKRIIALISAVVLLLNLLGCGKAEKEDRSIDSMRSFARYAPMVFATETADTIYFMARLGEQYLKYLDKATGISGFLCGKSECRHNSKTCNAYAGHTVWGIITDGERLFWTYSQEGKYYLYSMALDGTDRRIEAELPQEFIATGSHGRGYVLHDEWMYFRDVSVKIVDGRQISYNYIAAFPLNSSEKPFVILQEENPYDFDNILSIQFHDGYLYILTNTIGYYSEEDGTNLYDCKLRRWNAETRELETLYAETDSPLQWSMDLWVTDSGVYFNRDNVLDGVDNRIYWYDFDTGECEYLFDNGLYGWIDMGLIADNLITGYQITNNDNGIYDFYVVLKDFEGNVLVDETYTLDIRDGYADYGLNGLSYNVDFLGRDEEYAYYSFYGSEPSDEGHTSYISIISVALDGSGAQAMCTQTESVTYG